jgi:hypothetical protein
MTALPPGGHGIPSQSRLFQGYLIMDTHQIWSLPGDPLQEYLELRTGLSGERTKGKGSRDKLEIFGIELL